MSDALGIRDPGRRPAELEPRPEAEAQWVCEARLASLIHEQFEIGTYDPEAVRRYLHREVEQTADQIRPQARQQFDREIDWFVDAFVDPGSIPAHIRKLHATGLTLWVVNATKGLCLAARERVRDEIESHYADVCAEHAAKDGPPLQRHVAAMAGLGDPRKARRSLKRTYLTELERNSLVRPVPLISLLNFPVMSLLFGALGISFPPETLVDSLLLALTALQFILVPLVPVLHRARCRNPQHSTLFVLYELCFLGLVAGCGVSFVLVSTSCFLGLPRYVSVGAVLLVLAAFDIERSWRVHRKLRRERAKGG